MIIYCDQLLSKDTKFSRANRSPIPDVTTLKWFGQDYSDVELEMGMWSIRFETSEICTHFLEAVSLAQSKMSDEKSQPVKITDVTDRSINSNPKPDCL